MKCFRNKVKTAGLIIFGFIIYIFLSATIALIFENFGLWIIFWATLGLIILAIVIFSTKAWNKIVKGLK